MAKLVVFSHKVCWPSASSPSGYATDGGFPIQMRALSEIFEETALVVPCSSGASSAGELPLAGRNLSVAPLTVPGGRGLLRKAALPLWLAVNCPVIIRQMRQADAAHTPIPGDVGTIGMLLAFFLRKPLFVRHCGNWFVQETVAERFWKWFMERYAGGRKLMLATGGANAPPSSRNSAIRWIFSTTLSEEELRTCMADRDKLVGEGPRLVITCRQDKQKGTGVVIESLPSIIRDFPHTALDVIGDGDDLDEFKSLADRLCVSDRVTFHGRVDHAAVTALLRKAHLFCYPTRASEGFPKVVLEALACGLPVITTRVSVLPQLISDRCGILIEEPSPDEVARSVREIFSRPDKYLVMSEQAVATAREYSLERWRDTLRDWLRAAWEPLHIDA